MKLKAFDFVTEACKSVYFPVWLFLGKDINSCYFPV